MSRIIDFSQYKARRDRTDKIAVDLPTPEVIKPDEIFWLANKVKENLGNNLARIGTSVGEGAVKSLATRTVVPEILSVSPDITPFGFVGIARSPSVAQLCVTNCFANMFVGFTKNQDDIDTAAVYASVFSAGLLVAASNDLVPKVARNSIDDELWGRVGSDVQPKAQIMFRFAGGVVNHAIGISPEYFRPLDSDGALSPQLAGMLNPLTLVEMKQMTATTYKY